MNLLPVALKPFWQLKEDLSIEHSFINFQGRFYIPSFLRASCLKAFHQGHPGIVKMKLRAQKSMYWLSLNREIENHVMHCEPCQVYVGNNRRNQLFLWRYQVDLGNS